MSRLGERSIERDARSLRSMIIAAGGGSGVTDHGALTGLGDDDHSQYAHISADRTITAQHQFAPSVARAPFTLGVNAQGQLVTGLYADQLSKSITAGNGLTGGGILTSSRTITLGTPSSITPNTTNNVTTESHTHAAPCAAPGSITPDATASEGSAATFARSDHTHGITCAAPNTIQPDDTASEGSATSFARSDHQHGIATDTPNTIQPDVTAYEGTATSFARSDHRHPITCAAPAANLSYLSSNGEGDATGFARSNHVHGIDTAYDVGTTPAAYILRSTTAGGLTLGTLTVKGNVDITNGGDLTVGSNVFFVDVSGQRIGINCAPDTQFDLDVGNGVSGGNIRAKGFFVGRHALQLKGALMICHFDGHPPFETNFTGEPNGHMGQVPVTNTGGLIYRIGAFAKGASFGKASTNFVQQPSMEDAITHWVDWVGTGSTQTATTEKAWIGTKSLKVTTEASVQYSGTRNNTIYYLNYSTVHSFQFRVWNSSGYTLAYRIADDLYNSLASGTISSMAGWQTITGTFTTPASGTKQVRLSVGSYGTGDPSFSFYLDGVQIEESAFPTPYFDGSLGTNYTWSGTAHSSESSRTNTESTRYDVEGNAEPAAGTMFCYWIPAASNVTGTTHGIMNIGFKSVPTTGSVQVFHYGSTDTMYLRVIDDSGTARQAIGGYSLTYSPGDVIFLAITWESGGTCAGYIYKNGTLVTSGSTAMGALTAWATPYIYAGFGYGDTACNGVIDEFVILNRAISADEIRTIVESQAPVFAETSTWMWRTANNLFWADEEGMWMKDSAGGTVLGASGVDSKSWGGLTLNSGDILFGSYGSSYGAWLNWDRDGVDNKGYLRLGYGDTTVWQFDSGGATLNGVLDISTSGGIYQGSGSFATPTTGLKLWNDSGYGRIGGYNGGTLQWYSDTNGDFVAGSSPTYLKINSTGIVITATTLASDGGAYKFISGSTIMGGLYGYRVNSSDNTILLRANNIAGSHGGVSIEANAPSSYVAAVSLSASYAGSQTTNINILSSSAGRTIEVNSTLLELKDTCKLQVGGVIEANSKIYVQDTANGKQTYGITLNQLTSDDEIISLKSYGDVGHSFTITESDTYSLFRKSEAGAGGITIYGFKDSDGVAGIAARLGGFLDEAADSTKSTAAVGVVEIIGFVTNGSGGYQAVATDGNLLAIRSSSSTRAIFDGDGDLHLDGTSYSTVWDEYDDVALLAGVRAASMPAERLALHRDFQGWLDQARPILERTGVVTFNDDGHHFLSIKSLHMLEIDAIRQLSARLERAEKALLAAGIDPKRLEA